MVLVPVGHLLPDDTVRTTKTGSGGVDGKSQDWPALVDRARAQIIETMETRLGIKGLKDMIVWEGINTPETCTYLLSLPCSARALAEGIGKEKFNLTHGSILGITHDFFNVLSFRHQARHKSLKCAYFVGASAHPGTGVPIAIAGSRLCTEAVLEDLGMPLPRTYTPRDTLSKRGPLDRQHRRSLLYILEDIAWVATPYILGGIVALLALVTWLFFTRQHEFVQALGIPPARIEAIEMAVWRGYDYLNRLGMDTMGIPHFAPGVGVFLVLATLIIIYE